MITYQEENNKVLDFIFEKRIFKYWKNEFLDEWNAPGIELFITANCNQRCEYCYLIKHGDNLYPSELRDEEKIIENLKMILDWILKNNFKIPRYELFSGEIWGVDLGKKVLDTFLEYIDTKGLEIPYIIIPSNCSFIMSEKIKTIMDGYIIEFKKRNVNFKISISVDGLPIEAENRPFADKTKNALRDVEFYDTLFSWAKEHKFGFHPMVNAGAIDKWSKNFDWWMCMFDKYRIHKGHGLMMLEVRNDDWTRDKLIHYVKFLEHIFNYFYEELYGQDKYLMAVDLMRLVPEDRIIYKDYSNIRLLGGSDQFSCSLGRNLVVRLGDLSIIPCHRTSYPKLNYGKFRVHKNELIGMDANNQEFAMVCLASNANQIQMGCDSCKNNSFCMYGCLGSQYEVMKDPLIPIPSVCALWKTKNRYLLKKYADTGLAEIIISRNYEKYNKYVISDRASHTARLLMKAYKEGID